MKRVSKKIILLVVMLVIMFMPIGRVKGALQSNPDTHTKKQTDTPENWMINVRNMEKTGEGMGLSEVLNSDLTAETESNNIDVHLARSTEYGAVAILSASGYGNPQTLQEGEIKTTTGNKTGVYFTGDTWEIVAGGWEERIFSGVNIRYYDAYTNSQTSAKAGDAFGNATTTNPGCEKWHSAPAPEWVTFYHPGGGYPHYRYYFARGGNGIFSYSSTHVEKFGTAADANHFYFLSARGVASCGQGL